MSKSPRGNVSSNQRSNGDITDKLSFFVFFDVVPEIILIEHFHSGVPTRRQSGLIGKLCEVGISAFFPPVLLGKSFSPAVLYLGFKLESLRS